MATINGTALADVLNGGNAADSISGLGDNDTLNGNGGNDTLNGGGGDDVMSGGTGNDLYYVNSALDRVIEEGGAGTDTVRASISYVLPDNVESLILTGTDDLDGDGNSLANSITGNSGDNTLSGRGGNDTLTGGSGHDDLSGHSGRDLLRGDGGDDELSGGAGIDTLEGGSGADNLIGGAGGDLLLGGTGDDDLSGGAGNDTLEGGAGADHLSGGSGVDTVTYAGAVAGVSANLGGLGADGEARGDSYSGIENLVGSEHDDELSGDAFGNVIDGGAGADEIFGGGGDDTIHGDAADTLLDGGSGEDRVVLAGGGQIYDFASSNPLANVEIVDLSAAGNDTLILESSVLDDVTVIRVEGAAGDAVATTDLWILGGEVGGDYVGYFAEAGGNFLLVDEAIDRSDIQVALSLGSLDAAYGGVRINGVDAGDGSGGKVSSAGDVNGDGYDDVIVSSLVANGYAGRTYVVFGSSAFGANFDLSALDGSNGFHLDGQSAYDWSGFGVAAAGDVNGDGLGDLIVSAPYADPGSNSKAGSTYVVFGQSSFGASLQLSALDGTTGFRIDGAGEDDYSGWSVSSAGDVNGDGYTDVLVGAPGALAGAGAAYVVFGGHQTSFASSLDVTSLDGENGFRLDGTGDAFFGNAVAGAGDIDGDGYGDIVIGEPGSDADGTNAGRSYVVFGASSFGAALAVSDLNGTDGFTLGGGAAYDLGGTAVSGAGDFNGDGWADVIVSAPRAESGVLYDTGASYVVFGHGAPFSNLELSALDGNNGFRLEGIGESNESGRSVASAGDVNGDGFDDLLISNARFLDYVGETYLVFGRASGFGSSFELSTLGGDDGFRILGVYDYSFSGSTVSGAGDINGDGFADIIIGARGEAAAGASYVVYGGDFSGIVTHAGTADSDALTGTAGANVMIGGEGNDTLTGGGGADVFRGGAGNDRIAIADGDFADIDGGRGTDTLALAGPELDLDLTAIANSEIAGIEIVNLRGNGANTLTLALGDVLDLSDTSNTLTIDGGAVDSVTVVDGIWVAEVELEEGYKVYTLGAAKLLIDVDIALTITTTG